MLDENLPTFFLKATDKASKHLESFLYTQNGSEPEAQYALTHVDPASNTAKNTYAVGLYDSHYPDVLFGEVMAKPGWSHPTLSQEEIRRNGGVPPPPEPIFPDQFAIQLYNPETQIIVKEQKSKWSGTQSWEFSIPQTTFRTPSASTLDRTQNDPAADVTTPRVNFVWRKEGRYAKDMTCYLTGKSTDLLGKKAKKSKEPDIAVALFTMLKELTIMEPNLYRIEIEDYKGLEVVLLLSAAVIRDLFINNQREAFHIVDLVGRKNSGGILTRKASSPLVGPGITPPMMTPQPPPPPPYTGPSQYPPEKIAQASAGTAQTAAAPVAAPAAAVAGSFANRAQRSSLPPLQTQAQQTPPRHHQSRPPYSQQQNARPQQPPRSQQHPAQPQRPQQRTAQRQQQPTQALPQQPPRLDPRTQWEIDAETARLKAAVEAEAREQVKQEEAARKARRKAEADEERKTLQFLENERKAKEREEKERRRRESEVDKETERLRKQFGDQSNLLGSQRPQPQSQRHSAPHVHFQTQRPAHSRLQQRPAPVPAQPVFAAGPYLQPGGHRPTTSASSLFSNGLPKPQIEQAPMKAKKSFWGLRSNSETNADKLKKKKSSMF
ncbi:uncharacterized protein M421DRAFT_7499 [Didymella exigua CBS 183.55]|uniref:Uncharacterized protein n=1 Tax=Didymella exigua CBS 183.55 TaxID=1150837 RepID=A0A6A5RFP5_9PLEO|nr:uncharacterized protein M421DRAFT_7499 [Didymella exigua CBS 183.55]KAF1925998.1 hypothetical protein M421DRAFT_7499 [Didymella exigua CBS 183.55]